MTYRIKGLNPSNFAPLYGLSEEALAQAGAVRMAVTDRPGFPCRISLDDARPGETVLLLNHRTVQQGPYEARHAIFVTEGAQQAALFEGSIPPALDRRILSLRAFDDSDMMVDAVLVQPGEADGGIRRLFEQPSVAYIHAHNAIRGCFAAAVERAE